MDHPFADLLRPRLRISMKEITSNENRIVKHVRRLRKRKYRDEEGLFLIEGRKNVAEAVSSGASVRMLFYREGEDPEEAGFPEYAGFSDEYVLPKELFRKVSDTEESQGILAVVEKPRFSAEDLLNADRDGGNLVVLDQLQDPGNVGTILRTALGAGYEAAVILPGTCDVFSPKTVRATAGAVFTIPIVFVRDDRELLELVHGIGKKLAVTSVVDGINYYEADIRENTALVIGNEGNGVRESLLRNADVRLTIPMEGGLESLNASVAAGILMYEAMRRRKS
ncbi:MAG: RNA methyltransferase [Eubacteriales bacterium]|nr:RNA methyltransferase [Eubacteriales bacterium]